MRLRIIMPVLACFAMGATDPLTGQNPANSPADGERSAPPGEGVICAWAIYSAIEEAGKRCFPGEDAELQDALAESVARIDRFVLENSDLSAGDVATFKRKQAHVGAPEELVCGGDMRLMYESIRGRDPALIRSDIEKLVSRPGTPTWGTCL